MPAKPKSIWATKYQIAEDLKVSVKRVEKWIENNRVHHKTENGRIYIERSSCKQVHRETVNAELPAGYMTIEALSRELKLGRTSIKNIIKTHNLQIISKRSAITHQTAIYVNRQDIVNTLSQTSEIEYKYDNKSPDGYMQFLDISRELGIGKELFIKLARNYDIPTLRVNKTLYVDRKSLTTARNEYLESKAKPPKEGFVPILSLMKRLKACKRTIFKLAEENNVEVLRNSLSHVFVDEKQLLEARERQLKGNARINTLQTTHVNRRKTEKEKNIKSITSRTDLISDLPSHKDIINTTTILAQDRKKMYDNMEKELKKKLTTKAEIAKSPVKKYIKEWKQNFKSANR